ncbi:MAG: hypothetical protein P4K98_04865, partial [Bryobacteraceae bacterium]|nr:hypothetical protein [Bryobacteraceae bacterium]
MDLAGKGSSGKEERAGALGEQEKAHSGFAERLREDRDELVSIERAANALANAGEGGDASPYSYGALDEQAKSKLRQERRALIIPLMPTPSEAEADVR